VTLISIAAIALYIYSCIQLALKLQDNSLKEASVQVAAHVAALQLLTVIESSVASFAANTHCLHRSREQRLHC
jgi:hypothetical protein